MKKELISIIIPVYNTEKYLTSCLDSVINQTYRNLEIILVDDGSTDNSGAICQEYALTDQRIKYFKKENNGAASARNFGLKMAKGKYIGFVDSDDIIHKDMYLTLYKNLIDYNADLSICDVIRFSDIPYFNNSNNVWEYDTLKTLKVLLEDKKICSYSVNKLCKKKLIKNITYPISKLQEDVGTVYKFIMNANKIVYSDSKLYGYYAREDSITKTINEKFIYDYFEMIEARYLDLRKYNIDTYLNLNMVNVILGCYIDISNNKQLLLDKNLKEFMDNKYNILKKINTKDVKALNTRKHNILINILLFNRKIFLFVMNLYLQLKKVYYEKN